MAMREFLELTPLEFYLALKDQEQVELSKLKPICEAIRRQTWWLVNIQRDRKKRAIPIAKIMSFYWDKDTIHKPQTYDQMRNMMKAIASGSKGRKSKNVTVI